jgi:membrane protein DedA with SNARE-associated domain
MHRMQLRTVHFTTPRHAPAGSPAACDAGNPCPAARPRTYPRDSNNIISCNRYSLQSQAYAVWLYDRPLLPLTCDIAAGERDGRDVLEHLGALTNTPWIYALVAVSVLLDVFLPVLPSGVLVITAATAAAGTTVDAVGGVAPVHADTTDFTEMFALVLCAASASVLGDMVAYRLAWRSSDRLDRAIARSRKLASAQEKLGTALVRGGGPLVVIARFAPAGRSVVSLSAGAAHRTIKEFLPWSAVSGVAWAAYSVSLGYLGGEWLGATWLATAVSVLALFAAGAGAVFLMKRPRKGGRQQAPAGQTVRQAQ